MRVSSVYSKVAGWISSIKSETQTDVSQRLHLDPRRFAIAFKNIQKTYFPEHLCTAVSIKTQKIRVKNNINKKQKKPSSAFLPTQSIFLCDFSHAVNPFLYLKLILLKFIKTMSFAMRHLFLKVIVSFLITCSHFSFYLFFIFDFSDDIINIYELLFFEAWLIKCVFFFKKNRNLCLWN